MNKILSRIHSLKYRQKLILNCILVGILPLSIMAVYCYRQTISLLQHQEYSALDSAAGVAVSSIDSQIVLYEDLLNYLSFSDPVIMTPTQDPSQILATYVQLNYEFDVFLNGVYVQHPEILQITVYNALSDLTHGPQLRPVSDLEKQPWYTPNAVTPRPSWYLNADGTICVIQKIPNPFSKYIESYSDNYVGITLSPPAFFKVLENVSSDYHLEVRAGKPHCIVQYVDYHYLPLPAAVLQPLPFGLFRETHQQPSRQHGGRAQRQHEYPDPRQSA